ncbi:hypothetical protein C2S52_003098 [Perilla frutescens var. hirtella]|nr:hypothetical protein C2S52_003098 [Perilla frutescens var. hirtella]
MVVVVVDICNLVRRIVAKSDGVSVETSAAFFGAVQLSSMWDELELAGTVVSESSAAFSIRTWKWDELAGLDTVKKEFERYVLNPIKFPGEGEGSGSQTPTGILLYGPPGCGKNFLVRSLAKEAVEAGAHYIYVKSPELVRQTVAESELAVRAIFSHAQSPCILFFDWPSSLGSRGAGADRVTILLALSQRVGIEVSADLMTLGTDACKNFSGADLNFLMQEAALTAKEEHSIVKDAHFNKALKGFSRSVTDEQIEVCNGFSTRV